MNWANYQSVLEQLQGLGLLVDSLEVGKRQRVRVHDDREKRGWYHLHELRLDSGDTVLVGTYGRWQGNDPGTQKITLDKRQALTREQQAALKERIAADRKAAEAARKREAERAAERAALMWQRLDTAGECDYLTRKGVAPHGVRFAASGAMVLPLLDVHGRIHGLQVIYPSGHAKVAKLKRDKDFWPGGLQKQGHMFLIGSPAGSEICLLAEGYATGASVHEATGLPVAIAFDAGNLVHVATALRSRWPRLRVLVCADDDYLGKCRACGQLTPTAEQACTHCGEPAEISNAGILGAEAAALAVSGAVIAPRFAAERPVDRKGPTDWNDLHVLEGLHVVRAQLEAHLTALKWRAGARAAPTHQHDGGGAGGDLRSIGTVDELHQRFALVYEAPETVFDAQEHKLVPLSSMRNLCTSRQLHRAWMESHDKRIVRLEEVGFDPTESDPLVKCNLWGGWPTVPRAGNCEKLLELGQYLCSQDPKASEMWTWLLRWLAYPIQHPGAKMKTAVVMHGPQGTGKNLFFESFVRIYGSYGRVVGQDAVEDKFNDYQSRKLFIVADEVVAREEMYHSKNRLKVLVTSDRIRINPKNVASYEEANHVNLVFLSNEVMPMALERDDRRYAVIWTPPKWDAARYNEVLAEIRNGGIQALHDHLLHLDLGDFGPATLPPMTQAKADLIELGMDSSERFFVDWSEKRLPLPVEVVRTEDLYQAYRHWCTLQGVAKPAQLNTCTGAWCKRPGVTKERRQHFKNYSLTVTTQSVVIKPAGLVSPESRADLSDGINRFNEALKVWKEESFTPTRGRGPGSRDEPSPAPAPAGYGDDDAPY